MGNQVAITADALEILVSRELRKTGVEPIDIRRRGGVTALGETGFWFDLFGRLQAYDYRWRALFECRNTTEPLQADVIGELWQRKEEASAGSALLFTTSDITTAAARRATELRIALLRVVSARAALESAGLMGGAQVPMWLPEFATQVVWWAEPDELRVRLLEAGDPELILERLRP